MNKCDWHLQKYIVRKFTLCKIIQLIMLNEVNYKSEFDLSKVDQSSENVAATCSDGITCIALCIMPVRW